MEDTYPEDLEDLEKIQKELYILVDRLIIRLDKRKLNGRTLTVKIKFHDFTQITRSLSTPFAIYDKPAMLSLLDKIIGNLDLKSKKIRLLGVGISNFIDNDNKLNNPQLALF